MAPKPKAPRSGLDDFALHVCAWFGFAVVGSVSRMGRMVVQVLLSVRGHSQCPVPRSRHHRTLGRAKTRQTMDGHHRDAWSVLHRHCRSCAPYWGHQFRSASSRQRSFRPRSTNCSRCRFRSCRAGHHRRSGLERVAIVSGVARWRRYACSWNRSAFTPTISDCESDHCRRHTHSERWWHPQLGRE